MPLYLETIHALHEKLKEGAVTSTEVTRSVFDRIRGVEESVRCYITPTEETALEAAVRTAVR